MLCFLQCDAYGPVFTGKLWVARVSFVVYIMAIQSVMGELSNSLGRQYGCWQLAERTSSSSQGDPQMHLQGSASTQ